jgi:hypothetical protein
MVIERSQGFGGLCEGACVTDFDEKEVYQNAEFLVKLKRLKQERSNWSHLFERVHCARGAAGTPLPYLGGF